MELLYFENIRASGYADQVRQLLVLADREFIPPLSSRSSSTQADLRAAAGGGIQSYWEAMADQPGILALENTKVMGFMAFKTDHTCAQIHTVPNLYASTCVVHPDGRGKGLMTGFYQKMIELFPQRSIFTRTWATNAPHLRVLERLGFSECARLKDHRGPGMDTVYFHRPPE